jgi:multiple sugar transport system permease protein
MKYKPLDLALHTVNYVLLAIFFVFVCIPFLTIVLTSLKPDIEIMDMANRNILHRLLPDNWFNFKNFTDVWMGKTIVQGGMPFYRAIINTFIVLVITIIPGLFLALTAAYSLTKFNYPGKKIFYFMFLGLLMIPTEMISIPLYSMVAGAHLTNSYFGLMIPQFLSAFGIFLFTAGLDQIPNSYIEAGRVDGASELWIFMRVIFPMAQPFIITFFVIKSVWCWNDFFWPMLIITEDSMRTLTLMLNRFFGDVIRLWGAIMAAVLISMLPLLILFVCFSSQIKEGLMNSGVKG